MKNEAKMGLRGEQGGDEVSCKHACKCNAVAMQSLVSEIALLPYFNFGIKNKKFLMCICIFM